MICSVLVTGDAAVCKHTGPAELAAGGGHV